MGRSVVIGVTILAEALYVFVRVDVVTGGVLINRQEQALLTFADFSLVPAGLQQSAKVGNGAARTLSLSSPVVMVVVKAVDRVLMVVNTLAVTVERAKVIVVVVLETTVTTVGLMVVFRYWLQKGDASGNIVGASNSRRQLSVRHVAVIGYGGPATTVEIA